MKTPIQLCRGMCAYSLALAATILLTPGGAGLRAHEHQHTHASLSVGAVLFLDQTFPEDGALFSSSARADIRHGSIAEDDYWNFLEHFYDPKTRLNTHSGTRRTTAPERASWIWREAVTDFRSGSPSAFEKLGRVCHLLQDMTSPAHVHNDAHPEIGFGECADGDDFENWGWTQCNAHSFSNILRYVSSTNFTATLGTNLTDGLRLIFDNQPQRVPHNIGSNIAHSFVHGLADKVYGFTTFQITLTDTWDGNDRGGGELKAMFPSLEETTVPAAWWIDRIGYSQGQCSGIASSFQQAWWMMTCSIEDYCGPTLRPNSIYCVDGLAYIENTGGGDGLDAGTQRKIPNNLYPQVYNRDWYTRRYGGRNMNGATDTTTMLQIYGDVLYPAAVAYGAGLLQAFLDEAVMPRPLTQSPTLIDGSNARLNGRANPGGAAAVAWFEWGLGTNYGNVTGPQSIGAGTNFLSLSQSITGLLPETTYYYRLVSSNEFGVRHGTPQTLRTLNFILAGGGVNAWQITDDLTQSGSTLGYTTNLVMAQEDAAINNGWRFTMTSRLATDFGGNKSMVFVFGHGTKRFVVWWDLDAAGDLVATFEGSPTVSKLTAAGAAAKLYHDHEIVCTNGVATYRFDGVNKATWEGSTTATPRGELFWGVSSSPGMAQANFNRVRFEAAGFETVASYTATSDPVTANPLSQGWQRRAGTTPLFEQLIAPDGEPLVPAVETFGVSDIGISTARLNGQANPHGDATSAWFEWGSTTSYGNRTAVRTIGSGQAATNLSALIGSLDPSSTYHCRLVASNGFGIRLGNDQSFQTASYVINGSLPNAWQITDNSTASGSTLLYTTNLTVPQRQAAASSWRFTVISRLVTDLSGGNQTMIFGYGNGSRRYSVWLDFDVNTNLTALLDGQTVPRIVVSNTLGATLYHTHELSYTNQEATYKVDGVEITRWPGLATALNPNQVFWGAGAQGGKGQMNFQRVEFQVGGSTVVALYDSGTQANPGPAPTNTWARVGGTAAVVGSNLTEQAEVFLPTVETLAATGIASTSAQLNGRVNGHGQQTTTWFEWGASITYGNRTPAQEVGSAFAAANILAPVSGLAVDRTYHFRVVASNSVLTTFGQDQAFHTSWFADMAMTSLPALDSGAASWGDYDNDGDLDLLLVGQTDLARHSTIYRNGGGGSFAQAITLTGVSQGSGAWGDYDNDGDVDLILSGLSQGGPISRVYRNDRTSFVDIDAGLRGVSMSSTAWIDYDNDGDLDIFLAGADAVTNRLARLYRNDNGTAFVEINAGFAGISDGAVATGDFDGDGDHDLVLSGLESAGISGTRYYRNEGGGVFTGLNLNLPSVHLSSVAPADYDGDGDLDLMLSGATTEGELTRLFRNIREGTTVQFEELPTALADVSSGSAAWGDYDNDGDLDVALAGWSGEPFAAIYRNDNSGVFTALSTGVAGVFSSSVAWGDYDNDGDLDLLLTGRDDQSGQETRAIRLYRNDSSVSNAPPTAPSGLSGSGVGNYATVTWQPASDGQTPSQDLGYNVVLSTAANQIDIASPMADLATGYRRVVQPGAAGPTLSWTFTELSPGTYYFSVQAIDSAHAGGPFAPWQVFEIAPPAVAIVTTQILPANQVRIHFAGSAGVAYEVWGSSDLDTWSRLGPGITLAPGEFEFIDAAAPPSRRFYQVRRVAP